MRPAWALLVLLGGAICAPAAMITTQPEDTTVTVGAAATLTVVAEGTGLLAYQWHKDGVALPGATSPTYPIAAATRFDQGFYHATVSEGSETVRSAVAELMVAPASYPAAMRFDPARTLLLEDKWAHTAVRALVNAPDGKMVMAGVFTSIDGHARTHVVRFNTDYSVDEGFVPPNLQGDMVSSVVHQADGKLILMGSFSVERAGEVSHRGLIRLHSDGSRDETFWAGGEATTRNGTHVVPRADGKLWVALNGSRLTRLNADGSVDESLPSPLSLGSYLSEMVPLSDGRLLLVMQDGLAVVAEDGTFAAGYEATVQDLPNPSYGWAVRLTGGQIVLGGRMSPLGSDDEVGILRLNADGSPDSGYVSDVATMGYSPATATTDGAVFYTRAQGGVEHVVIKVGADGVTDATFVPPVVGETSDNSYPFLIRSLLARPDGWVVVAGDFLMANGQPRKQVAVVDAVGALQSELTDSLRGPGSVAVMAQAPGGKVYLGGSFTHIAGVSHEGIARLDTDGGVDESFSPSVVGTVDVGYPAPTVAALVALPDGRLLAGGRFHTVNGQTIESVVRLHADGSVDDTFATHDFATDQALVLALRHQWDGRLLVGGDFRSVDGFESSGVVRLGADGGVDTTLDAGLQSTFRYVRALELDREGGFYVGGRYSAFMGASQNGLSHVGADDVLDTTFAPMLNVGIDIWSMSLEAQGLLLGRFRLLGDGTPDPTFDPQGRSENWPRGLLRQADGRVWEVGDFSSFNQSQHTSLIRRFAPSGGLDETAALDTAGSGLTRINAALLTDNGEMWVGGDSSGGYSFARLVAVPEPLLVTQPESLDLSAGGELTLRVEVVSEGPYTVQWLRDGEEIAGATGDTLYVRAAQATHAGSYTARITNANGSVVSAPATVTVAESAPRFRHPSSARVRGHGGILKQGTRRDLEAPALEAGSAPLSYAWTFNGVPIAGADGPIYSPGIWELDEAGAYQVTISNALGSVQSLVHTQAVADTPDWHWRFPQPQGDILGALTYANGRFVAGGGGGTIMTSTDGLDWSVHRLGITHSVFDVCYGNGRYLALSVYNQIWTSVDGQAWIERDTSAVDLGQRIYHITFGDGMFVAVGTWGLIMRSPDGENWTRVAHDPSESFFDVAHGPAGFVAVTFSGRTLLSADGLSWERGTSVLSPSSYVRAIAATDDHYVILAHDGLFVSADGQTWERCHQLGDISGYYISATAAGFLVSAYDRSESIYGYLRSTVGRDWEYVEWGDDPATGGYRTRLSYGAGRYVAMGGPPQPIITSTDGESWSATDATPAAEWRALAASADRLVVIGADGVIMTSTDGISWSAATSGTSARLDDVIYAAGRFVASGAEGWMLTSADGLSWSATQVDPGQSFGTVAYLHDRYFLLGHDDGVWTSTDTSSWQRHTTGIHTTFNGAAYGAGLYLLSSSDILLTSPDGENWTQQSVPGVLGYSRVSHDGQRFVLVSTGGQIRTSVDGQTWVEQENPIKIYNSDAPRPIERLFYTGGRFISVLDHGADVNMSSADGVTWEPLTLGSSSVLLDVAEFQGGLIALCEDMRVLALPLGVTALAIETEPEGRVVATGEGTALSVAVSGTGPFTYQWLRDGAAVPGATNATLNLPAGGDIFGAYAVVISNALSSVTSREVVVEPEEVIAPQFTHQSVDQAARYGQTVVLYARASGTPRPTYQWTKDNTPIPGATSPQLVLEQAAPVHAGTYRLQAINAGGSALSDEATLTVLPDGLAAMHTVERRVYAPGGTVTITNTLEAPAAVTTLVWQVLLPEGWSLASSSGDEAAQRPTAGTEDLLEWTWASVGTPPHRFSYTLEAPGMAQGPVDLAALVSLNLSTNPHSLMAHPDPLYLVSHHSADMDGNQQISLAELLRVIELYNTRYGTARTGRYQTSAQSGDGFAADAEMAADMPTRVRRFHSGDYDRNGRFSLAELLRVIEIYNTRTGTQRNGRYRTDAQAVDGFAPNP